MTTRVTATEDDITTQAGQILTLQTSINSSTASALSALTTRVTDNEGDITSTASAVTALTTTVGGNTASISTQASSINGLGAKYTVKVDVNGHVAGFGLASVANNGAVVSEFIVAANKFAIVDPGNGLAAPIVPFAVSGGVVTMQNVVIGNALIENLAVGKLTSGTLTAGITQNADINVGTGRIIFDNGSYMKVNGVGFGASSDLIEWYGVRPASGNIALCTKANAIYYLDTSGGAYFGGTLTAGTIFNSGNTTGLNDDQSFILGPFGTNGDNKTVVLSYAYFNLAISGSNPTGTDGDSIDVDITLERRIGGGSWTTLSTPTYTGTYSETFIDGSYRSQETISGSTTVTDTNGGTGDFEYRATLTDRTNKVSFTSGMTQTMTIAVTEE